MGGSRSCTVNMTPQVKSWLGLFGVVTLLVAICLVFMFIVPLESYSGASCDTTNVSTATDKPNINSCLCSGPDLRLTAPPAKQTFHLLRGEMQAYQDAKPLVDICYGDQPIKR